MQVIIPVEISEEEYYSRQYEEFLVRRDQLFKEAGSYLTAYTAEFGDLMTSNFELKVECIKTKKAIGYCSKMLNSGLAIDVSQMKSEIEQEMKHYYLQLKEMMNDTERAKKAEDVGEFRYTRSKKIYRRLAKMLHPDINIKTLENENLKELWTRIVDAYHRSDVDALEDLEVLVRKEMKALGDEGFEIDCTDIEKRIERVERQINDIISTEPYIYGELLQDEERKKAYREQLESEHNEYMEYLESLTKTLNEMLCEGGFTQLWETN